MSNAEEREIKSFILNKLMDGKFSTIATLPDGKSMDFQSIPHTIRATNRGSHFTFEMFVRYEHRGTVTVTVKNLIRSIAPLMGRAAGSAKSEKKTKSSRENGKLGGRPRKVTPTDSGAKT